MRLINETRLLRSRRALTVAALALLSGILLVPSATSAASPYGHLQITYRNKSTYVWQVNEAFAVWNRAGTPFRFVPARSGRPADITITQKPYIGSPKSAIAGYGGIGFVLLSNNGMKSPKAYHTVRVRIVAHEIGHALGLGHTANRCALMYGAGDFPKSRPCSIVDKQWDGRQPCGPRDPDIQALARLWRFKPRAVAWRGYCTVPTDPAKAAKGPYVAGKLTAEPVQYPYEGPGVQLTLTNTGNTLHEIGSYGIVVVDRAGRVLPKPFSIFPDGYYAVRFTPAPGKSVAVQLPPCDGELPLIMRVRLASVHHDAFLSPEVQIRLDSSDGDPAAPANECVSS
ncbi:MAG: matrixin family metalloprotease [Gaiellaceae bacterium]